MKQCRAARVDVAVVGGGNSAGQAVVRFSRYASRVTLLVRGSTLSASMSQYLVSKVSELDNVDVRTRTEVVGLEADTRLRAVVLSSHDEAGLTRLPLESLFVCIGGVPRTHGLATAGLATDDAGFILTGADVTASPGALDEWPLSRSPLPLETNLPGLLRRRRRAQRIDQALFGRHRRGIDGSRVGTPPPCGTGCRVMTEVGIGGPSEDAVAEFAGLASDEQIDAAASALERNGITSLVVDSGEQARDAVRSILPIGAEVFNNTSRTLEAIGVAEDIERSGLYQPLRPRLYQMDREMQAREMRQLARRAGFRGRKRSRGHRGRVRPDRVRKWKPTRPARLGCRAM